MARAAKKTRRGSPEAIAKRRAARSLNRVFDQGAVETGLDGRTLKRKKRLLKELQDGKRGETLKAHEVLGHVTELLKDMGETLTTIRRLKPRLPPTPAVTGETVPIFQETQRNYNFDPRAWKVLGLDIEEIMGAPSDAASSDDGEDKPARKARKKTTRRKKA
jgi:hypothetical protein